MKVPLVYSGEVVCILQVLLCLVQIYQVTQALAGESDPLSS